MFNTQADIKKAIASLRTASTDLAVAMQVLDPDSDQYKMLDAQWDAIRAAIKSLDLMCK